MAEFKAPLVFPLGGPVQSLELEKPIQQDLTTLFKVKEILSHMPPFVETDWTINPLMIALVAAGVSDNDIGGL